MSDRNKIMTQVVRNLEQVYDPEMPSISVIPVSYTHLRAHET